MNRIISCPNIYYRNTSRPNAYILNKLTSTSPITSVLRWVNLSVTTIIRRFDLVQCKGFELPEALSIDEFKGNTSGEKYQCILTDPINKIVLDILPKRYGHYLVDYFEKFYLRILPQPSKKSQKKSTLDEHQIRN